MTTLTTAAPAEQRTALAERFSLLAAFVPIVLVVAAFARFTDVLYAGTDSLTLAVSNRLHSLADLVGLFFIPVMPGTSFAESERIYRPAASVVFALDNFVWGLNPVGFHITNIELHAIATFGLFVLARRLGASRLAACVGASVFAIHPAMVAAIPIIARRDNVVSAAPFVWSMVLLASLSYGRRRWFTLAAALLLYAVALLGKESGFATLPLVPLIAWLTWRNVRRAVLFSVPFALVWVALFAVRWAVVGSLGGYTSAPVGQFDRAAYVTLLTSFVRYTLWPFTGALASDSRAWLLIGFLLLAATVVLAVRLRGAARDLVLLGCAWLVLFVAFYLAVRVLSGAWLMYYPLMGLGLVVTGLTEAARVDWRKSANAIAAAAAALLALSTLIASPLVRPYPEWRAVGELSQRYLQGAVACLSDAPSGTHVVLDRPPGFYNAGPTNDLLVPVVVADYTLASALEVEYPDRQFKIESETFADVTSAPDRLSVTCSGTGSERVVHAAY